MKEIKKIAIEAAKQAGEMAREKYYKFDRKDVELKSHNEYVTQADKASEKIIIDKIKEFFPLHHILSEESGDNKQESEYTWIVDPIDGTTNFTMHNPYWCISIGVAKNDEVVVGVVYAPIVDEMYVAVQGEGATLNDRPISVSDVSEGKTLNAFCSNRSMKHVKRAVKYFNTLKLGKQGCYQLGSAALELAYVAAGRLDSMLIPGAYAWDVAAGVILVKEAGGKVSDFFGAEWNLASPDMLAANLAMHEKILKISKDL